MKSAGFNRMWRYKHTATINNMDVGLAKKTWNREDQSVLLSWNTWKDHYKQNGYNIRGVMTVMWMTMKLFVWLLANLGVTLTVWTDTCLFAKKIFMMVGGSSALNLSLLSRGVGEITKNGHEKIDVVFEPQVIYR